MSEDRDESELAAGGWAFLLMLGVMSVLWAPVALVAYVVSRLDGAPKRSRKAAPAGFSGRPSH